MTESCLSRMLRLNSLEARNFILCMDQKPLTYAFKQKLDKCSPRQALQLDFISQFTTDIRHIKGSDTLTAETLSRIASMHMPNPIDYHEIAKAQENDYELISLINNPQGLEIKKVNMPDSNALLYCDISTKSIRPFISIQYRKQIFDTFPNLSHPGVKTTNKLISTRFIWLKLSKDCTLWSRQCIPCQKSKIIRHTKSPIFPFQIQTKRCDHIHLDIVGPLPPSRGFAYCLTMIDRYTR
ncbi:gag-pol polyprotein [Trichonephila clavipes]|nr:gag-pol polyprotein [Trichonephila clavipes]